VGFCECDDAGDRDSGTSIETALTAAATWTETRGGKRSDDGNVGKFTQIGTTLATYTIKGFS
jgi:hypothetical protein